MPCLLQRSKCWGEIKQGAHSLQWDLDTAAGDLEFPP